VIDGIQGSLDDLAAEVIEQFLELSGIWYFPTSNGFHGAKASHGQNLRLGPDRTRKMLILLYENRGAKSRNAKKPRWWPVFADSSNVERHFSQLVAHFEMEPSIN
jgi:hypothetical protein